MNRKRFLQAGAAAGASALLRPGPSQAGSPPVFVPLDRNLVFEERFDGPADAPPIPGVWNASDGYSTSRDDQMVRWAPDCCYLDGKGHLVLLVAPDPGGRRPFKAGRVATFVDGYGWPPRRVMASVDPPAMLQARIRQPPAVRGLWTAFWPMAVDMAHDVLEVDVQEFRGFRKQTVAVHVVGPFQYGHYTELPAAVDPTVSFLDYRVAYYPDRFEFSVHVPHTGQVVPCGVASLASSHPVAFRLTNQVGVPGEWSGRGGPPPPGEYRMLVQSVKAWRL